MTLWIMDYSRRIVSAINLDTYLLQMYVRDNVIVMSNCQQEEMIYRGESTMNALYIQQKATRTEAIPINNKNKVSTLVSTKLCLSFKHPPINCGSQLV